MANEDDVDVFPAQGSRHEVETGRQFQPKFDRDGLIPAIVRSHGDGDILMFAWMNAEALRATVRTRVAHFWSRSRQKLWRKGEESGNLLKVVSVRTDCDQDAVVLDVDILGDGVACHTGARSCFYRAVDLTSAQDSRYELVDHPAGLDDASH